MNPPNNSDILILSVLICTTPERNEMFSKLFTNLHTQLEYCQTFHKTLGKVEILVDDSIRFLDGGLSVGKKREALLKRAEGKYVCYLDSDEGISPDYLETMLRLCYQGHDICTFRAMVKLKEFWSLVDMRLDYQTNDQINPSYTVRRRPWHICAVRTKYAKKHSFPDVNNAEDFVWMERVLTHCVSEAHTERIIFEYRHGDHSEVDKIPLP